MKNFASVHIQRLQEVMRLANEIRKTQFLNFKECLKIAWAEIKLAVGLVKVDLDSLKTALLEGFVLIKAKKVNKIKGNTIVYGEVTERIATLNLAEIPQNTSTQRRSNKSDAVIPFVSVSDNNEWRCFRADHILSFEKISKKF